jgi:hypothetical protein
VRKTAGIFLGILLATGIAQAQIPTRGNVFVGYSFSRTDTFGNTANLNGWEASLEGKFLPWIGIVADFGGGYGSNGLPLPCPSSGCGFSSTSVSKRTYLFGPRVAVPIGRFTPFVHALIGAAHVNDRGSTDTSFASAIGGGLDYKLIKGVAWRGQLDNVHTNFFSRGENHIRFSTGVDFRF